MIEAGRYIPGFDHLIPPDAKWENFCLCREAHPRIVLCLSDDLGILFEPSQNSLWRYPFMPVRFRKVLIADERYESAGVFDVDNDGVLDIVSGGWWYEGPDFKIKHRIGEIMTSGEYFDDFSTIPVDINGNGYLGLYHGRAGGATRCAGARTPGAKGGEWPEHIIAETGNVETTRAWDVDGDGQLEIVPNCPGRPLIVFKLITRRSRQRDRAVRRNARFTPRTRGMAWGLATSTATAAATSS